MAGLWVATGENDSAMGCHGLLMTMMALPWAIMAVPWVIMAVPWVGYHGSAMGCNGLSWTIMALPWVATGDHGSPTGDHG